jgi:hypothetical protein
MSGAVADPSPVLPFNDPSRPRRMVKVGAWLLSGEYCFIPSLSALRWLSELDT